jgi:GNAT superfamily N-acetyltransferase
MQSVPGFWQQWWSELTVDQAIQSARDLAFVWEQGSRILGLVCAHDFVFRAYLSEIVVDPDSLRRGIGTGLIQAVEESLRQKGQQVLIAAVWRDAELFYRSLGWEPPDVVLLRQHLEKKRDVIEVQQSSLYSPERGIRPTTDSG